MTKKGHHIFGQEESAPRENPGYAYVGDLTIFLLLSEPSFVIMSCDTWPHSSALKNMDCVQQELWLPMHMPARVIIFCWDSFFFSDTAIGCDSTKLNQTVSHVQT